MHNLEHKSSRAAGFSLFELIISMAITLIMMGIGATLLGSSFKIRGRENQRSSAIADAQRSLNMMSREIANAGYGLSTNGIVAGGDSGVAQIRVRSDLDLSGFTDTTSEDIKYILVNDANGSFILRMDLRPTQTTSLLANRIDGMVLRYYDRKVTYTIGTGDITNVRNSAGAVQAEVTPDNAKYVVLVLTVSLPEVGQVNTAGYQPPSSTQLVSDITLRNADLSIY